MEKIAEQNSLERLKTGIVLEDLKELKTNPRFVMFDACYNGSFHEDGYIARYYIFNDGNTVVTQGNSRNVLQDRWTIEMIGLLSQGVRVDNGTGRLRLWKDILSVILLFILPLLLPILWVWIWLLIK